MEIIRPDEELPNPASHESQALLPIHGWPRELDNVTGFKAPGDPSLDFIKRLLTLLGRFHTRRSAHF
jgi:hypothetical protein